MKKFVSVILALALVFTSANFTSYKEVAADQVLPATLQSTAETNVTTVADASEVNPFAKLDEERKTAQTQALSVYQAEDGSSTAKTDQTDSAGTVGTASKALSVSSTAKQFVVQFKKSLTYTEIANLINGYSYELIGDSSHKLFAVWAESKNQLETALQNTYEFIEQDGVLKSEAVPNDAYYNQQWAPGAIDLPNAWELSKGSADVKVAVIDSGIMRNHEDFANVNILSGYDYLQSSTVQTDTLGHGTAATGIIAVSTNNAKGIAGVCWNVTVIPYLVLNSDGEASGIDVCDAIIDAADAGADVINLSLGSNESSSLEEFAVNYAMESGCIVVAAAGNDGNDTYCYPASYDGVISCGAIDSSQMISEFSNYNNKIDVVAPGEYVLTTYKGNTNTYAYVSGTSFSSPYVAGVAALARACNDNINASQFSSMIQSCSTDKGDSGYDNYYGYGIINARQILVLANGGVADGQDFNYTISNNFVTITKYVGPGGAVTIPSTIEGLKVTAIGYAAFWYNSSVTSVTIPLGVESIGGSAFANCTSLAGVTIPWSVTTIGAGAFGGCTELTGIAIPWSVLTMGSDAFSGCTKLSSVSIAANLTSIGDSFFKNCTSLTQITLPDTLRSIGAHTFEGCTALESVVIPSNVNSIGSFAFAICTAMTELVFPSTISGIQKDMILGCTALSKITVHSANPNYTSQDGVLFNKDKTTLLQYPFAKTGSYTVPDGVTSIAASAFVDCTGITELNLPASLTSVTGAIEALSLAQINVNSQNTVFSSENGALFNKDKTEVVQYPRGRAGAFNIPEGVTSIRQTAFAYSPRLTFVQIPSTMGVIPYRAFYNCTGLIDISFGNNVTQIGAMAFTDCHSLKTVVLPASLTTVGGYCFGACYSLTAVYFMGNSPDSIAYAFDSSNISVTLYYLNGKTGFNNITAYRTAVYEPLTTAPTELSASDIAKQSVTLSWNAVDGATGYNIYLGQTRLNAQPITATNYTVTGLVPIKNYSFTVKAVKGAPESPSSDVLTVKTAGLKGDVNGDDDITFADITMLSRFLAGWNITVQTTAMDVTGDNNVTFADITLISRFLAGWNVTLQ